MIKADVAKINLFKGCGFFEGNLEIKFSNQNILLDSLYKDRDIISNGLKYICPIDDNLCLLQVQF